MAAFPARQPNPLLTRACNQYILLNLRTLCGHTSASRLTKFLSLHPPVPPGIPRNVVVQHFNKRARPASIHVRNTCFVPMALIRQCIHEVVHPMVALVQQELPVRFSSGKRRAVSAVRICMGSAEERPGPCQPQAGPCRQQ